MNFKYETQGTSTYIVYEIDELDVIDSMTLGMITNNKISGLAQAFFFQQDNTKYVKYNISSKVSAEQFLMGAVNKKRLMGVFKGIVNAMISAEEYMIEASNLCLDLKYIYTDVTTCETVVLCLPIMDTENPLVDLKAFFKNIIFSVQFDQTENGDYIAKLINYLNRASTFSLYEFKEVIDEIEHGVRAASKEEKNAQKNLSQTQAQNVQHTVPQVQTAVVQQIIEPQRQVEVVAAKPQEKQVSSQDMNAKIAIPEQKREAVQGQAVQNQNETVAQSDEKEISWFYLMQHYNKENAAIYKAQQEAKKAAKAMTAPTKKEKKESKKKNKDVQNSTPNANLGFAIPGVQTAVTETKPQNETLVMPNGNTNVQNMPPHRPVGSPAPQSEFVTQQASIVTQPPVSQTYAAPITNFGETTVLSGAGIGETTVLGTTPVATEPKPYLIRTKNNEKIWIDKPVFRIGKERSYVDYFIGDNSAISRGHANIITRNGEYFIQDTNSTNHTYVDGMIIQSNIEVKINHETKIRLANEDFEFKLY